MDEFAARALGVESNYRVVTQEFESGDGPNGVDVGVSRREIVIHSVSFCRKRGQGVNISKNEQNSIIIIAVSQLLGGLGRISMEPYQERANRVVSGSQGQPWAEYYQLGSELLKCERP